jgi:hypothetical protein
MQRAIQYEKAKRRRKLQSRIAQIRRWTTESIQRETAVSQYEGAGEYGLSLHLGVFDDLGVLNGARKEIEPSLRAPVARRATLPAWSANS